MTFDDGDDFGGAADPEATEKLWDELSKHNRRQQERMQRAIEERRSRGVDDETAFREALRDVVPDRPDEETERSDEPWRDDDARAASVNRLRTRLRRRRLISGKRTTIRSRPKRRNAIPLLQQAMDLLVRFDTTLC